MGYGAVVCGCWLATASAPGCLLSLGSSFIQGATTSPQNAGEEEQLHGGKRTWVGLEGEMVHEKVLCSLLSPPASRFFLVLAGLHTGVALLWVISIVRKKKKVKPRDDLGE